jgi:hypothetical protein
VLASLLAAEPVATAVGKAASDADARAAVEYRMSVSK